MPAKRRQASPKNSDTPPVAVYEPGKSPHMDAWFTSFFIENHLDYFTNPKQAATEEQVRFMVYTCPERRYYPCSDEMFAAIITRKNSAFIQKAYHQVLQRVMALVERQIEDDWEKTYLETLLINKYQHETRDEILIPSRLEKRLMRIYLNRTLIEDPFANEKSERNARAQAILDAPAFKQALNHVGKQALKHPPTTIDDIKSRIAAVEFQRLLCLANSPELWTRNPPPEMKPRNFLSLFAKPVNGNGLEPLLSFLGFGNERPARKRTILWLADEAGETVVDLAVIRFLVTHGHKVIVAFKAGPLYTKTDIVDIQGDNVLRNALGRALVVENPNLSKNELVRTLRGDIPILALSDGTFENINLLLVSTTFARMFKEVDGVISRGLDQRRRFFDSSFQFTQDIFSIAPQADGTISILFKARHPEVIKFSHSDLERKASAIIDQMSAAKSEGMTVIFYSGIIGSIPGKIAMAKAIMSTFVAHLKQQSAMTFIINPSEYYEPGMDADDLMYMWEIVQRSGRIDIWRFQTYEDIVTAFQLTNKKIPPEWVGKDATYSTGCTKEMAIAIDVQQHHPEMQIIGPAKERFMRRKEYGVGKMYDQRLSSVRST
ncbi:MAG: DUF89 family protein [Desulfatitalea sp.]|nr:DUF89 family protein [Desulfatitalea sp.]NNK01831.1 DUF89 family protein [Desulfatitalea sp.]